MFAAQYRGIDDVHTHEEERRLPLARPKKTISRPYRITVRFTDMEYGLITDAAEETGVTLSEYIRKMVLEGKIAIRYEVVADIPELQKLTAEFGKIGSNLNQIARYFHTGGVRSKTMQDEIQSCISELWNLRKDVTRMAGDFHGSVETYRK